MKEEFCDKFSAEEMSGQRGRGGRHHGRPHHKRGGKNKHSFGKYKVISIWDINFKCTQCFRVDELYQF